MKLSERDLDVLGTLAVASEIAPSMYGWLTPYYCGGCDGSHHSKTLAKLVRHKLAASKLRGGWSRGSKLYRILPEGRMALTTARLAAKLASSVSAKALPKTSS